MFRGIKVLIDTRMGKFIAKEELVTGNSYFIKIAPKNVYEVARHLMNDPDVKLNLLDQIIAIPPNTLPWTKNFTNAPSAVEILYQFRSLKLPYRVTLAVDINPKENDLPSINSLFTGATWLETDLEIELGINFVETMAL